jgi:type IV pilus assembly protein PilQ
MELRVRRVRDGVEVVIENTGSAPQLEQTNQGGSWLGRLTTSRPAVLLRGPQAVALPEAGVRSLSIEGSGTVFTLRATPVGGYPLRPPLVSADGRNVVLSFAAPLQASLQTTQRNSLAPGAVANPNFVPPLRARATAPPVGDMAVGTMVLKNPNYLNVRGPRVTLTFKGVPASNALQALARLGRYGFVYNVAPNKPGAAETSPPVTASFVNEDFRSAMNLVLASSNLQAKLVGNTIVAGQDVLYANSGNLISKVYRLNQASAKSAAEYLASLGAIIRVPTYTEAETRSDSRDNASAGASQGTAQAQGQSSTNIASTTAMRTQIIQFGGEGGPLTGLGGTTDTRLGTITLVGIPSLVSIAEQYLKQIDLRQRQVALSVRILDVSLGNDKTIDNSFAFRYGNNFIVNQQGQLLANFGSLKPPSTREAGLPGLYDGVTGSPIVGAGAFKLPGAGGEGDIFLTPKFNSNIPSSEATPFFNPNYLARPGFGTYSNPGLPGVTDIAPGTPPKRTTSIINGAVVENIEPGTPDIYTFNTPTAFQYPRNQFFDFVRAVIESRSTKILASPTLILSEDSYARPESQTSSSISANQQLASASNYLPQIGRTKSNESVVIVGEQVITSYNVQAGQNGAANTCQPVLQIAGLTFGAKVTKIDDNGFVTFALSPSISGVVRRQNVEGCGFIDILSTRALDTGAARVRDGQTLILTGVLSDRDIEQVSKWPVLGDLPLVGQFFRNTGGNREKRELIVMVTPRIINDTEGGSFGYGFEPSSRDSRRFMNSSPSSSMPSTFTQP